MFFSASYLRSDFIFQKYILSTFERNAAIDEHQFSTSDTGSSY